MEIKRDYQSEYNTLIASWNYDDINHAQWITERIAELREHVEARTIERDYQTEYDMLILASTRAIEMDHTQVAGALVASTRELLEEAGVAGNGVQEQGQGEKGASA